VSWWSMRGSKTHHQVSMILQLSTANENGFCHGFFV
jgi:hypothetical protein